MTLKPLKLLKTTLLAACLGAGTAWAYDQPSVNMGGTSFFDGAPLPGGPGFYFVEYLTHYSASRMMDNGGNTAASPPSQTFDLTVPVSQLIYVPEGARWGNTQLGFQALLPWVAQASVNDGMGNAVLKGERGIGDLAAGVWLQFDPIMGEQGPLFSQRFELQVIAPTGHYDRTAAVSPGSNFWSFDPYWAVTVWASPKLSFSGRFNYLWNARNSDPNAAFGSGATSTQAGQALHGNFAVEYEIRQGLVAGLSGYWLKQISDTRVNGVAVPGRREQVVALGPAAMVALSPKDFLFFNYYREFAARNRTQGDKFQIRYDHHF
ncbi:phenol degradation protein meta [Ralstonia pseudosolanacearum]|uniref:SphA family protein n=1 Tax=Ralstonia pseudosolanacearum TaxID=1310165 RepID=UPI000DACC36C|nr:transporter [Ralstonia pseudosolanacearum]AZU58776.1 phenol degradation protein meta [Ralstonia solanacearum]MCK4138530.1 phenol degradation protein meta [Ralstonia pseudosolanacearum]QVX40642.1 transporter [Ralstonia solanacearum]RAA09253.1 phenol degradation protein meta [Ralstonia pseudosolanacearum]UQY84546.1 transporter [Ralstonia pseudosolanacearum]